MNNKEILNALKFLMDKCEKNTCRECDFKDKHGYCIIKYAEDAPCEWELRE